MTTPDRYLPQFFRTHRDGFRLIGVDTPEIRAALAALLPDPDAAFQADSLVKPGSRTHAGFVMLQGRQYFLKRYNCRGWKYRLRHVSRCSRAIRAWHTTWGLWLSKVPVPRPLIVLEERKIRLLGRSYILMESLRATERLIEAFDMSTDQKRFKLLDQAAGVFAEMHACRCVHGDLKWSNILVGDAEQAKLYLVDLDGARIMKKFAKNTALKDVQRFIKDLAIRDERGEYVPLFCELWEKRLFEALQQRRAR